MENTASGSVRAIAQPRRLAQRLDGPAVAAWTLAFALIAYLALSNGGYDTVVRSQVGIAVWWVVLLGALAGILPGRVGRAGWVAIGLLGGFALWTGLATTWSESAERSVVELGRAATYLGVLVLAIALQGRAAARHTINGLACAIGGVTLLAVLSRLHPQWFPANDHLEFLGQASARKLSYPLNYWNALAAFAAMGVPLLLGVALGARTLAGRSVATAMLPLSSLCIYLTISRGGVIALIVGVVVFLAFVPRRIDALGTLGVAGLGSVILLIAAAQRDGVQDGLTTAAATDQGSELIWLAVITCGGVALVQVAISLAARHLQRPTWLVPDRRSTALRGMALFAVVCAVMVAAGGPGWAGDRWQEFKAPVVATGTAGHQDVFSRLGAANGSGRYGIWQAARNASGAEPWTGIGPGTFEFWWARNATSTVFVRDAHSMYLETLAETGIIGFALLVGLLVLLVGAAVARSLRASPELRIWIAAAVGGLAAFMSAAVFEWVWEMAAIGCAVMVLAAVILGGREESAAAGDSPRRPRSLMTRPVLALLAVAAIGAVAVPMAGALANDASRDAAADGRLDAALKDSQTAERVQPYAASAHLQRALVLERRAELSGAAAAATAATVDEPTNWRTWLVLARINARLGKTSAGVAALREARRLNPQSAFLGAP